MDMFTMHDRRHGMKVAHLMWHTLTPEKRKCLSPPEIGLLVLSAYLHDAGMALTGVERERRLAPDSDIWSNLENPEEIRQAFLSLQERIKDPAVSEGQRGRARIELQQAEEAVLTNDTRHRHATRERYYELLKLLTDFHSTDKVRVPDLERAMSFDGDSFKAKLVDVCVSHNESADALVERDRENFQLRRFPREYPVGRANADLQLVAAALRLADILDFDRERTPSLLFHYLLPGGLSVGENISKLEWSKHLAISNWEISDADVVFRGRCASHIVHHAIVQFCKQIESEISSTHASFKALAEQGTWPFILPNSVKPQIQEEGYHYVPYSFELDDARIYRLLMGGAIYDNPLAAVRELIQNAVDACALRDALTELYDPSITPAKKNRIVIRYEEPENEGALPLLIVEDTGTGMDAWLIERWFLRVGRSYYSSSDFNKTRLTLRAKDLDFAPVSEFGIGFLSCFLLADRVEVETAMWEAVREDTRKRHLTIDGPTRLIRVREENNAGAGRFKGTRVTLHLCRGSKSNKMAPPTWNEISQFVVWSCEELPYTLRLENKKGQELSIETVVPKSGIELEPDVASHAVRIAVDDKVNGLEGEIVLISPQYFHQKRLGELNKPQIVLGTDDNNTRSSSVFLRGGFRIGHVPGVPQLPLFNATRARLRQKWQASQDRRYNLVNLARNEVAKKTQLAHNITRICLEHLIKNRRGLPERFMDEDWRFDIESWDRDDWSAFRFLEQFNAYEIYELIRQAWVLRLDRERTTASIVELEKWERGEGPPVKVIDSFRSIAGGLSACILPRIVSQFVLTSRGYLAACPPVSNWRKILKNCHDFTGEGGRWPVSVEYDEPIKQFLFVYSSGTDFLNKRFEKAFKEFTDDELRVLISAFVHIISSSWTGRGLTKSQVNVLAKIIKENPDFIIRKGQTEWELSAFSISE
jgi:hypothetical protein